jgi:heme iron utilization protein
VESETEAVAHMNADHAEAVRLYATGLAGQRDGAWTLTGIDPDGLDLLLGTTTARVGFTRRVSGPGVLQKVLKEMAATVRSTPEPAGDSTKD